MDLVSKKMKCDPTLIRINRSILMSMQFDNAVKRIMHVIEGPMNRIDDSLPNEVIVEGLSNVNAGCTMLTVTINGALHRKRFDYYLIKGGRNKSKNKNHESIQDRAVGKRLRWITFGPIGVFLIPEHISNVRVINHERIHWEQQRRA
jgi:hypothetical protein